MEAAAASRPMPIQTRTVRLGQRATTPAPSHAPRIDEAVIENSVSGSTSIMEMNTKACAMVGNVFPAFSVPGTIRSGTIRFRRNTAVVVANDPMPSVSKKLTTAPRAI